MLNVLRDNFKRTPYLKWVLGLVVVGLIAYLGNFFIKTRTAENAWAARVNGVEISLREFRQRATAVDSRYRQLLGDSYEQYRQPAMIAREAIEQLITGELILQDARRLGLRASKQEIADLLGSSPQFQDPATGQFIGAERYFALVGGQAGAAAYERMVADEIERQRWAELVGQGVTLDDKELADIFRRRTEKTGIDYAILTSAPTPGQTVGDADLQAWYDGHREDYRRGEARRIRYLVIEREKLAPQVAIGDEQVSSYYTANQDKYRHPEQRRARHILFKVDPGAAAADKERARAKAAETLGRVQAGADTAELARSLSEDPGSAAKGGDLGFFSAKEMVTPFSEAVFATAVGEFAPVTESPFGFHVIQVTGAREEGVTPLEEVREEIRRDLASHAAQDKVLEEAQRLRTAIGETGERLQEVATKEGLPVKERLVIGRDRLADIGASPEFAATVAQLAAGALSQPLRVAAGLALVTVDEVLPPALPPFEEVRERVVAEVLAERARQAALAEARRALERHDALKAAAAALTLTVKNSAELAPGQGVPGIGGAASPELDQRLFGSDVKVGDRGAVAVAAGALLYEVTRREPFDPVRFETEKAELRGEMLRSRRAQYAQSVLAQLRQAQSVQVNEPVLGIQ